VKNFWKKIKVKDVISGFLAVVVLLSLVFYSFGPGKVLGATYTFVQNSWTTESADTAVHPTNQSSWAKYSAKDANITAGASVSLTATAASATHTTDTDFSGGTLSSTIVSGTGSNASVKLGKTNSTSWTNLTATVPPPFNFLNYSGFDSDGAGNFYAINQSGYFAKYNTSAGAWTNLTTAPSGIYGGLAYDGAGNFYASGSNGTVSFAKYNTSTGWTDLTATAPLPFLTWGNDNLAYGGDGNFYLIRDNTYTNFAKYNTSTGWTDLSSTAPVPVGTMSITSDGAGNLYATAFNNTNFAKYNISTGAWTNLSSTAPVPFSPSDITSDGAGNLYATGWDNTNFAKYNISTGAWTNLSSVAPTPFNVGWVGGGIVSDGLDPGNLYVLGGNNTNNFAKLPLLSLSSGTYTSASVDLGQKSGLTTLSFTKTTNASTTLTVDIKAGNTATPDGTWTEWQTNISTGGSISSLTGNRYVQYRANLSTSDTAYTPSLDDITINYNYYPASVQTLTSSIYNTTDATNFMSKIQWTGATTTTAGIKFQLRTSPDTVTWTNWLGPDGTTGTYFENSAGTESMPATFTSGNNDKYFQYKAFLTSDGASTPTLSSVTATYVVNATPQFDSTFGTNGVSVSQISNSSDPNFAKAQIQYAVKDTDTTTGTNSPNYVTPTFEYNIGGGWVAVNSANITWGDAPTGGGFSTYGGNTTNKVLNGSYLTYTTYWDAKTQIPETYYATAQIRVTVNDNEGANNTATATGGTFALDVKNVTMTAFTLDSAADTIILNLSDDNNIEYKVSNNADSAGSDWRAVGGTSTSTTFAWTFSGTPSFETVYLTTKDAFGNTATTSATAPSMPQNFMLYDISNPAINSYKEMMSWEVYTASTTAAFSSYKIYRSTNGVDYSLLTTISDINTNSYTDSTVASTTTYYYKVRVTDTGGDISSYSTPQNDLPDGQGGSDFTAPVISAVAIAETQATWAKITWATDEMADSKVEFSTAAAGNYASNASSTAYVTSHSVTVTGLTPATDYIFRIKSKDIMANEGAAAGIPFTTASGPAITDVVTSSVTNNSAEITWNTNSDSNSYVIYSTNTSNLTSDSGVSTAGSADAVGGSGPLYYHKVTLPNLLSRTTYYYYVKSIAGGDTVTDKNSSNYYTFTTSYDNQPPVISNISTPVRTADTLIVFWNTDELADSQVDFGLENGIYTNSGTLNPTLTMGHALTLSSLTSETIYHYRIRSADSQGNIGYSSNKSATTTSAKDVVIQYVGGGGSVAASDTTPPSISNIKTSSINAFDATVTFDTNEISTGYALYGKDKTYGNVAASPDLKTSHSVKMSGLVLGTEYHYKVKAQDKFGNFSDSEDKIFTTKFATEALDNLITLENAESFQTQLEGIIESIMPSLSPPFISKVEVSDVTENSAVIKWLTNIKSYGSAAYVADKDYDGKNENPYKSEISDTQEKSKSHEVNLTNLSPSTKYHLQTKSFAIPGVVGKSKNIEFITKSSKIAPEVTKVGNTQIEIRWTTSDETSSFAEYRNMITRQVGQKGDNAMAKVHSVVLDNLTPATSYEIKAFGYDVNNNIVEGNTITIRTKQDVVPPELSSIKVDNALVPGRTDRLQTIVFWKTNEPANSIVYYEEGISNKEDLANKAGDEKEYTTDHAVIIANFKPSTVYRIKVVSEDEAGNKASSPVRAILTPRSAESIIDVIFKNFQESFGFLKNLQR